jgi:D-glycerate 3-kinase
MLDAEAAAARVASRIAALAREDGPPLVGLNGAQGAGKSTLAKRVADELERQGLEVARLSLDDFYLDKGAREDLAVWIHPLCRTRGVPGTHDGPLLERTLRSLTRASARRRTPLPRFDKLADDRLPESEWAEFEGRPGAILLEGWCVGLRSEDVPAWAGPINALERDCDPRGQWFDWSRTVLANHYDPLWRRLALLVSIEVPDWTTVIESRLRQERELAAASGRPGMDREAIVRFVEHYERYTRALWAAMPARADMLLRRNEKFGYSFAPDREL